MKTMIEYLTTMIVVSVIVFVLSSFIMMQLEIINARNYHSAVVEKLQEVWDHDDEVLNNFISENDYYGFKYQRQDDKVYVIYNFDISLPFIGKINNNKVVGYAG